MGHLQDHMHAYYSGQVAPGGVLDQEEAHRDDQAAQWVLDNIYYDEVRAQFVLDNVYYGTVNLHQARQFDQWMEQLEAFAAAAAYYQTEELHHLSAAEMHAWLQAFVQVQLETNVSLGYASRAGDSGIAMAGGASHTFGFLSHATLPMAIYAISADTAEAKDLTLDIFLGGTTSGGSAMGQLPLNLNNPQADPQQSAQSGVTIDVVGTLVSSENATAPAQGGSIEFAAGGIILPANSGWYFTITNNDVGAITLDVETVSGAIPLELSPDVDIVADVKSIELTDPDTQAVVCTLTVDQVVVAGETISATSDDLGVATVAPASDVTDVSGITNFVVTSVGLGLCNITLQVVRATEDGRKVVIPVRIL